MKSKTPYIFFELTKVEPFGCLDDDEDILKPSLLTDDERANFPSICSFSPDFFPEALEPGELPADLKILSYEILYDSIRHGQSSFTFDVEGDQITGSVLVLVRYHLNQAVNVHAFYTAVEHSRVKVEPSNTMGWFHEDHNGYSRPLSARDAKELLYELDLYPHRTRPVPVPVPFP